MIKRSLNLRKIIALGAAGVLAGVLVGCSTSGGGSSANEAEQDSVAPVEQACAPLKGKTISFVVPYEPGGGYDSYVRILAPHFGEELGATAVVRNQPGAGGLLALNNLLKASPDGTTIAIMNGVGAGGASMAGSEGASFSLGDFTFLGRVAAEPPLVVTSAEGPYQSFDDIRKAEKFRWGSTGPGAEDYVTSSVLTSVFDLNAETVTGFPGSGETEIAVIQGTIDGMSGNPGSRRSAVEQGTQTPVLVMGEKRPDWLATNVPLVADIEMTTAQAEIVDAHLALIELGRPLVGPPGMDQGIRDCLRDTMDIVMGKKEVLGQAKTQKRELNPLPGVDVDKLVERISNAPAEYKSLLKTLY